MGLFYGRSGDIIEIIVKDSSDSKIDSWKFNTADKKLGTKIMNHILRKYGFSPSVTPEESVNELTKPKNDFLNLKADW